MTRPRIFDTFMVNDEFEMLECRLETMAPAVDHFIAIEAEVDHQGNRKPFHLSENLSRFAQWRDKLHVIKATGLPTTNHASDPWAREWAQRDFVWQGLRDLGAQPADIVLHGDVDEICRPLYVRNARPKLKEFITFEQRCHCFAVDWLHPDPWGGTVAVTVETAQLCGERVFHDGALYHPGSWQIVRNQRNGLINVNFDSYRLGAGWKHQVFFDAGWHFSWLGGQERAFKKLGSFCHPEIADRVTEGLTSDLFMREGWHVDGRKMRAVEVDDTWPAYIFERRCPPSWFRPR